MKLILTGICSFLSTILIAQDSTKCAVFFATDSYALTKQAIHQLDSLLSSSVPARLKLALDGYCDIRGTVAYNDRLSRRRINTVKNYLVAGGVMKDSIVEENAHGERNPLNENKTEDEKQLNRQVAIHVFSLTLPTDKILAPVTLKEKIEDDKTTAGSNIILGDIHFYGGMHRFLPAAAPVLADLLETMKSLPSLKIRVEGHICCLPTPEDGLDTETGEMNLSAARAKAVVDYLVENGIEASRLSFKGFGHANPVYSFPENSEAEKTANRRVEIKVISK